jgi:hypothetical protein
MKKVEEKQEEVTTVETKITQHQLSKLKTFEEQLSKGREIIGGMTIQFELQKKSVLDEISKISEDYGKFKDDLKEQYGEVDVDISTGIYSERKEQ